MLVDKLTPRFDPYKRGDVVVFDPPADWVNEGTPYIKRVIGLPGETVEIRDDGLVQVDGVALAEPYVYNDERDGRSQAATAPATWTIPAGDYFLMGDHRSNSADSRVFGPVAEDRIIGRAWLRYWPIDTFGMLPTPTYVELAPAAP